MCSCVQPIRTHTKTLIANPTIQLDKRHKRLLDKRRRSNGRGSAHPASVELQPWGGPSEGHDKDYDFLRRDERRQEEGQLCNIPPSITRVCKAQR